MSIDLSAFEERRPRKSFHAVTPVTRKPLSSATDRTSSPESLAAVSVIVTAYSDDRWNTAVETVTSALRQSPAAGEVILVVDHNHDLAERARAEFDGLVIVENTGPRGASGARNAGAQHSRGEILAFLDDDQVAETNWLASLCRHFDDPDVIGVGGGIALSWPGARPRWFPPEFDWVLGGSYAGMPEVVSPVRNVWGGNSAVRRTVFDAVGGFRGGFGKLDEVPRPEDTDFCLRTRQAFPVGHWLYDPAAQVAHKVPLVRTGLDYFATRCWHEGRGKAALVDYIGIDSGTSSERHYATRILPRAVVSGIYLALMRMDVGYLQRSVAIVIGLIITVAGMAAEMARGAIARNRHDVAASKRPTHFSAG